MTGNGKVLATSATVDGDSDGNSNFYVNQLKALQLKANDQRSRKGTYVILLFFIMLYVSKTVWCF